MDISNIYFKKTKVLKYLHKTGLKLVGIEINKENYLRTVVVTSWEFYRSSCWWCRSTGTGTTGFRSPQALDKEGERSRFYHFRI